VMRGAGTEARPTAQGYTVFSHSRFGPGRGSKGVPRGPLHPWTPKMWWGCLRGACCATLGTLLFLLQTAAIAGPTAATARLQW